MPVHIKDAGTRTVLATPLVQIRQPDRTGGAALPVVHEKVRALRLWCEFFRLAFSPFSKCLPRCVPTSGGAISGVPPNPQIVYAGNAQISATGAPVASVIYAKCCVPITGAAMAHYGSVVSNTFTEGSKAPVHYDNALQNELFQVGNYKPVGRFSWSKY